MSILDSLFSQLDKMEVIPEVETVKESEVDVVTESDLKALLSDDVNVITEGKKDPKAAIRNKPEPIFDDKNPKVTDSKDHFPISSLSQARNALARAGAFKDNPPKWFKGTVAQFQKAVKSAVKKAYPSIDKE